MRNLVVILGAGASVGSGLPSLAGIFEDPAVNTYLQTQAVEFYRFLCDKIWEPRNIKGNKRSDGMNLEEILTILNLWSRDNHPPLNFKKNSIYQRQLRGCVYHSVYHNKRYNGCSDYNKLIQLCDNQFDHITWASFNWDLKLEQAFYYTFIEKGIGNRLPRCYDKLIGWEGTNSKHLLLKLHGSVSWFEGADESVVNRRFGKDKGVYPIDVAWEDYLNLKENAVLPVIADPSFFKHEDIKVTPFLSKQWEMFDNSLKSADCVLVIGYSLPDGDAMSKQSLITSVARNPKIQYIVIDPDRQKLIMTRYKRILGENRVIDKDMRFGEFLNSPEIQKGGLLEVMRW
jgi:hypothetical protein